MAWRISYSERALNVLKKMDQKSARRIVDFMDHRIAPLENPRASGKSLKGGLGVFWRYRVGDYRVLCEIQGDELNTLVVLVGHRKDIYS